MRACYPSSFYPHFFLYLYIFFFMSLKYPQGATYIENKIQDTHIDSLFFSLVLLSSCSLWYACTCRDKTTTWGVINKKKKWWIIKKKIIAWFFFHHKCKIRIIYLYLKCSDDKWGIIFIYTIYIYISNEIVLYSLLIINKT